MRMESPQPRTRRKQALSVTFADSAGAARSASPTLRPSSAPAPSHPMAHMGSKTGGAKNGDGAACASLGTAAPSHSGNGSSAAAVACGDSQAPRPVASPPPEGGYLQEHHVRRLLECALREALTAQYRSFQHLVDVVSERACAAADQASCVERTCKEKLEQLKVELALTRAGWAEAHAARAMKSEDGSASLHSLENEPAHGASEDTSPPPTSNHATGELEALSQRLHETEAKVQKLVADSASSSNGGECGSGRGPGPATGPDAASPEAGAAGSNGDIRIARLERRCDLLESEIVLQQREVTQHRSWTVESHEDRMVFRETAQLSEALSAQGASIDTLRQELAKLHSVVIASDERLHDLTQFKKESGTAVNGIVVALEGLRGDLVGSASASQLQERVKRLEGLAEQTREHTCTLEKICEQRLDKFEAAFLAMPQDGYIHNSEGQPHNRGIVEAEATDSPDTLESCESPPQSGMRIPASSASAASARSVADSSVYVAASGEEAVSLGTEPASRDYLSFLRDEQLALGAKLAVVEEIRKADSRSLRSDVRKLQEQLFDVEHVQKRLGSELSGRGVEIKSQAPAQRLSAAIAAATGDPHPHTQAAAAAAVFAEAQAAAAEATACCHSVQQRQAETRAALVTPPLTLPGRATHGFAVS